ncbi:MAG TPA: hypothetical protein VGW38_24300 [Chloroflexota bacterium]|nr:hypothetical protein [Chloroflexota bacterium]
MQHLTNTSKNLRWRRLPAALVLAVTLMLPLTGATVAPSVSTEAAPQPPAAPLIDARIQIVWPHDAQGTPAPVASAPLANVEVYLFQRGTLNPVSCGFGNKVVLRWSQNTLGPGLPTLQPAHDFPGSGTTGSMVGQRITRYEHGKIFPVWVFNDVPTGFDPAQPLSRLPNTYFFVDVEGVDSRSNVWGHAAFGLTALPQPILPSSIAQTVPSAVDAYLQVVWPHDAQGQAQPVLEASLVDIAVDLTVHPPAPSSGLTSVGINFGQPVRLLRALNSGYWEVVKPAADAITTESNERTSWPRWHFNDVEVSAAQDPANKYYFTVQVEGVETHPTLWSHGADPRTVFPEKEVPATSALWCRLT